MERWNGGTDFDFVCLFVLFHGLVFSLPAFISGNLQIATIYCQYTKGVLNPKSTLWRFINTLYVLIR